VRLDADIAQMLLELAAAGLRPIVHQKACQERCWVAYTEGAVRWFHIGEGPDPESAVRSLYVHTFKHPTPPGQSPEFTAPSEEATSCRVAPSGAHFGAMLTPAVTPTMDLDALMRARAEDWLCPSWWRVA
jgi:hypothetical protein